MRATLDPDLLHLSAPHYTKKTDRVKTENENVLAVLDMDKKEWRSVNVDRIISIDGVLYE